MRAFAAIAAFFLALALAGGPALASGHAKTEEAKKDPKAAANVEMPILVAPIVVDGRLVGYAYVSSTLKARTPAGAIEIRAKTPFIQDAFVRDVNATPLGEGPAPDKIDQDALKARLLADARRIVGTGKVVAIQFVQVQITQLRPNGG